jgi:membrane protein DedA with SNARE-associated domain
VPTGRLSTGPLAPGGRFGLQDQRLSHREGATVKPNSNDPSTLPTPTLCANSSNRRPSWAWAVRPERLSSGAVDAIVELMEQWVVDYGYVAIFWLMLAESACIPFPSEVTMLVGGWYSATGGLSFFWVGTAGVAGNLVGSWIAYAVGRSTGRTLLDRYGKYVLIRSHDIDRAEVWWAKYGDAATFFSRLLPVIRTFISLPAGIARMPIGKFSLYTFLGVIPWTFALTWIGVVVEDNWERVLSYFDVPTLIIAAVLVVAAGAWYLRRRKQRRARDTEAKN